MRQAVSSGARVFLAAIWIWAGVAKALDPYATLRSVRAYQLLPEQGAQLLAFGLPFLEIALGVLLLLGLYTRPVAMISLALIAVFVTAIASAWARGLSIDCGCFGAGTGGTYLQELGRDGAFAILAAWLLLYPRSRFALERTA